MDSYEDLLNQKASDVKRPPPIPAGGYLATVESYAKTESGRKKTPGVQFIYKIDSPGEDIDPEEVNAMAEYIAKARPRETHWITADSLWRLKNFLLEVLKIPDEGQSLQELLPMSVGRQAIIVMEHIASEDGHFSAVVGRSLPVSD